MAKRKPINPPPFNTPIYLQNGSPNHRGNNSSTESGPQNPCQDGETHNWSTSEDTNAEYARLDNQMRDFVYGISRGYSVRHACRMSGENYERMLDYLNIRNRFHKPDLLKLVDKARAVAYARAVEKLNAASDWHAAAFWLERRERKEFAPPRAGDILEEDAQERKALIRMSPETLEALSEAYDAEHGTPEEEKE